MAQTIKYHFKQKKIGDLGAGRILADVKTKGDYTKIGSPIYSSP